MARNVFAVARLQGSLGDQIAADLAHDFGIPLVERQILEAAAESAGVSPETIGEVEKVPSFLERMLEYLGHHSGGLDPLGNFPMEQTTPFLLSTDSYRSLIENVLKKTAQEADSVIVGHGGAIFLRDVPYVFRVLITAPFEVRAGRLQEHENLSHEEAVQKLRADDKNRVDYFQTYYKVNWLNPALYDLTINTARVDGATAVDLIKLAQGRIIHG